jgi:hypothetical protein
MRPSTAMCLAAVVMLSATTIRANVVRSRIRPPKPLRLFFGLRTPPPRSSTCLAPVLCGIIRGDGIPEHKVEAGEYTILAGRNFRATSELRWSPSANVRARVWRRCARTSCVRR